jgi:hypothetical protein
MDNDFKQWLCEKAKSVIMPCEICNEMPCLHYDINITIEILIKAMWAINRDDKWEIEMDSDCILVKYVPEDFFQCMLFRKYNNSEQKALEAALLYIYKEEIKNAKKEN